MYQNSTGILEVDVTFEGEDARKNCTKFSEHDKFIPAKSFAMSHLPDLPQRETVFNLIKHQIDLTVAIKARGLSKERPDIYPDTDLDYPGCKMKGKPVSRSGSGFVCKIVRHPPVTHTTEGTSVNLCKSNGNHSHGNHSHGNQSNGNQSNDSESNGIKSKPKPSNQNKSNENQPNGNLTNQSNVKQTRDQYCRCEECRSSDTPQSDWGEINVFTNVHVVYDASEVEHTTCIFFYDAENCRKIELKAEKIVRCNVKKDWCRLNCLTHDTDFLDKLQETQDKFNRFSEEIWNYHQNEATPSSFVALVSHPHGEFKQVSIGRWLDKNRDGKYGNDEYFYDAPTCYGSSGAYVYIYGGGIYSYDYLHKGCTPDLRLNFSTRGWESL